MLGSICLIFNGQYDSTNVYFSVYYSPFYEEEIAEDEADTLTDILSIIDIDLFDYYALISIDDTTNVSSFQVELAHDSILVSSFVYLYDPIIDPFDNYERIDNSVFLRLGSFEFFDQYDCIMTITDTLGNVSDSFYYIEQTQ